MRDEHYALALVISGDRHPALVPFAAVRDLVLSITSRLGADPAHPDGRGVRHAVQRFRWSPGWAPTEAPSAVEATTVGVGRHAGLVLRLAQGRPGTAWCTAEAVLVDVGRPAGSAPAYRPDRAPPARDMVGRGTVVVTTEEVARYARLSGDHNPIHLDTAAAAAAGLPGTIQPGLLTLGRAVSEAISLTGETPDALVATSTRFSRPVAVDAPCEVTVRATEQPGAYRLDVACDGSRVLRDAVLQFATDGTEG